ncbi:MAG TPA: UbiA family prenyltransferase [archaeon]|nr:UbiA family prenyltransferase [archaeon]
MEKNITIVAGLMVVAVWAATIVARGGFVPSVPTLIGMAAVFLIYYGGSTCSKKEGNALAFAMVAAGVAVSYFVNASVFAVSTIIAALLMVYSLKIRRTMILGNLVRSGAVALAFVCGGLVYNNLMMPLAVLIFFTVTGLEVYMTIDDAISDHKYNEHSTAIKLGVIQTRLLGNIFLTIAIIYSFLPFFLGAGRTYLFFAIIADVLFIVACIAPARYSSKMIQVGIALTVIAFAAGVV